MAFRDENDDPTGGTGTDWWTQNAPPPDTFAQDVTALYNKYRPEAPPSAEEIQAHRGNPGGLPAVENLLIADWQARNKAGAPAPVFKDTPIVNPGPTTLGVPTTGFGAAPTPYTSDANAPVYTPMATYVPPTWTGGDYKNPTVEELYASPGYQARLDRRLQGDSRRFAAQGTILNGGTLKALDRDAQDYATGEYQTLRNNTYDAYVQKYKQFTDAAGMDLNARTLNANENQNTFANRTATYSAGNQRTLSDYLTNLTAKRNSELDYWNRLQDVSSGGASLAGGSR